VSRYTPKDVPGREMIDFGETHEVGKRYQPAQVAQRRFDIMQTRKTQLRGAQSTSIAGRMKVGPL
jgi:hypothetical protein